LTDNKITDISKYFSDEVLSSILASCELAYSMNQRVCTPTHLFQMLSETSYIKELIVQSKINLSTIDDEIRILLRHSQVPISIKRGKVVFSPSLKITILQSYLIANSTSGNNTVGLEELLLSVMRSDELNQIIKKHAIDISPLVNLIASLRGPQTSVAKSPTTRFIKDLIQMARDNKLEPVVNRENELSQVIRILTRQSKNNIILLGEVGVGKSSIVNLLTLRISLKQAAPQLNNSHIVELNLSGLLSALAVRNVNDLTDILQEEIKNLKNPIVFIKNFVFSTGNTSVENSLVTNMIKSLISSKDVKFIISMTSSSYKKILSKEQTFTEFFETVKVAEPSMDLAIKILEQVSERLTNFHKIEIDKEVIASSVNLSKRYIQDKFLPAKAIDLLDEASSKVVLENRSKISVNDIKTIISEKTGIPIEKLTVSEQKKLINLEEILSKDVIGQNDAVHTVSEVVRRSRAGLKDPKKPIGSFLFLGPSGVGKTFLAKNLARIVYDNENAMIRLDMSEFSESHTVQRLIGSPPGYVGYEEGGQLTNPVWEKPYSLILLDEIEKAHLKVFDIFLQVLDEGRLTDGQGRTVDFKNTIIIATSNIASEEILQKISSTQSTLQGFEKEKFYEDEIIPILKTYFRPEFINRFDEVVIFNPLGIHELKVIASLQIAKIQQRLKEKKIVLKVSDEKLAGFAQKSYKPAFGARPLIRLIQEEVENVLARKIISGEIKDGDTVNL
jgi:ATP-dependent Clp protease ATP-binding subunit ClpC